MSPRRTVYASLATGCSLAAAVVVGGYAASGALPFSQWPAALFSSNKDASEVALAPIQRTGAPVLSLAAHVPAHGRGGGVKILPLDHRTTAQGTHSTAGATHRHRSASATPKTSHTKKRRASTSRPTTPASTTAPRTTAPASSGAPAPPSTVPPTVTAAPPAADREPVEPAAPATPPSARRVTLGDVSSTFVAAAISQTGQPELRVQMALADPADTQQAPTTVALSLKLAPTDVQALLRTAAAIKSSRIALETEVDVVDSSVQPACSDGQCLRVQMKFAQDTRPDPADQPEVELLDDASAMSNRVKVVVKIDPEDLPNRPAPGTPAQPDPASDTGPAVLSLPLPADADPEGSRPPATGTATVSLPEDAQPDPAKPEPPPAVQVKAELEVVDTPAPAAADPATDAPADPATDAPANGAPAADAPAGTDCP